MDILENITTPYYLLDLDKMNNNYDSMERAFKKEWSNFILGYSLKTNSLPWLIKWFKRKGAYAEVVSSLEYKLSTKLGFDSEKIIFNGPHKGWVYLKRALEGNAIVNLDSFHEIEWLKRNRPESREFWSVGLRINFDLEAYCPGETVTGSRPGRFGFNIENNSFEKAVEELRKIEYVKITGLHGHHSTKTRSLKVFVTITDRLIQCSELIGKSLSYIDIGGCFFGDKTGAPSFKDYAAVISETLHKRFTPDRVALVVEPGAALVASPFYYMSRVIDVKEIKENRLVSIDGSILNIDPHLHGIKFEIESLPEGKDILDKQIICGNTCLENDRLELINQKELRTGDMLIFKNVGAYSLALTALFIHYLPPVVVKDKSSWFYARRLWRASSYLHKSLLDDKEKVETVK